jgi:hypothetical protein
MVGGSTDTLCEIDGRNNLGRGESKDGGVTVNIINVSYQISLENKV